MKKKWIKICMVNILVITLIFSTVSSLSEYKVSAAQVSVITSGDIYYIRNIKSGRYLDVSGGGTSSGTNVQIWDANTTDSQRWRITYLNNGYYVLRPMLSDSLALDVYNNYTGDWSNIDVWNIGSSNTNVPSYAQWLIESNNDGTYKIMSKCSGDTKGLDTDHGITDCGTNVIQYTYNGDPNMKWVFEKDSRNTYLLSWKLLDSGKHLDWDGSTTYQDQFNNAVSTWNNYKSGVIRQDTMFIDEDVYISDAQTSTGEYATTYSDGRIVFNTNTMNALNDEVKQKICTHELGHALGLGHSILIGDVMRQGCLAYTSLSRNDKESYDLSYNNNK